MLKRLKKEQPRRNAGAGETRYGNKGRKLLDFHQPPPRIDEDAAGPVEVRAAARVHAREVSVGDRIHPRGVGDTDCPLAISLGIAGLERLAPLALGDFAMCGELTPHLVEVPAVADLDELETLGASPPDYGALVSPALGVMAVALHHRERLVLGSVAVENELEDLAHGGPGSRLGELTGYHELFLLL